MNRFPIFRSLSFALNPAFPFALAVLCPVALPASSPLGDLGGGRQPASTRRMIERVDQLWQGSDPIENFYLSDQAVEVARIKATALSADIMARLQLLESPERYLLFAGRTAEALAEFQALKAQLQTSGREVPSGFRRELLMFEALCHLRLGEQQNCLHNHNADSCLFPIAGGGVHTQQDGSRNAIRLLSDVLQENPDDLEARWLLNIAAMTVDEYPAGVPEPWRIDPAHFASDYDLPRFPDVAGALGLAVDDLSGGVIMDDFDNDGFLDLVVSGSGPRSQLRVFRNEGDGSFADRTVAAGVEGVTGGLNLLHADFDNDGFIDVLVLRTGWLRGAGLHPNSLLRNNGDFTFTDVTEAAGLLSFHPTQTAAWFDYNGDGWLDLFIGNETWASDQPQPCELYRNNGDGTFTEVSREFRLNVDGYVKAVVAGDYDNDGRPDLYLSLMGGRNILLHNEGPARGAEGPASRWRFRNTAQRAGVIGPMLSFPSWWFDYDNDGWLDLFVSGYNINTVGDVAADYLGLPHQAELPRLYRNRGDETFEDVTAAAGVATVLLTMGCNFGDLDNDGWLDFYAGTGDPEYETLAPSRMFRNDGQGRFQDVTTAGGFGQLQKGHGIAFGDIDNDGDQDIYSVVGGVLAGDHYPNQLFANPGNAHHWVTLKLEGVKNNRSAIGARLKLTVTGADGVERTIHRLVGSGGSFGGSPLRQEIGLGEATEIRAVEIFWPATGETQQVSGVTADGFYRIREGMTKAEPLTLGSFALPVSGAAAGHHHH